MIPPGKARCIGAEHPGAERFERLVAERFGLDQAVDAVRLLERASTWASPEAYRRWLAAYRANAGTFLDHPVWGADRYLGHGRWLWGAMDDRWATNAARVFAPGGLDAAKHVAGKRALVVGAWDGTECLLLSALGASSVDALDEVPAFCDMARAQYSAWQVAGRVLSKSIYELDVGESWQAYELVYVPGVVYHLTDIVLALTIAWAVLAPGGCLAMESICEARGARGARYVGASTPGWNWWSPTPECHEAMLRDCGFPDARTVECARGRGWWMGTRATSSPVLDAGAAGFSRPDILRAIAERRGS